LKVIDFCRDRKATCDFILVIDNCDLTYNLISYEFKVKATFFILCDYFRSRTSGFESLVGINSVAAASALSAIYRRRLTDSGNDICPAADESVADADLISAEL